MTRLPLSKSGSLEKIRVSRHRKEVCKRIHQDARVEDLLGTPFLSEQGCTRFRSRYSRLSHLCLCWAGISRAIEASYGGNTCKRLGSAETDRPRTCRSRSLGWLHMSLTTSTWRQSLRGYSALRISWRYHLLSEPPVDAHGACCRSLPLNRHSFLMQREIKR